MEAMRSNWTDERLDDLNTRVDQGFNRVEAQIRGVRVAMRNEFASVRQDMKDEFASVRQEMKEGFALMEKRFERMEKRFDGFQQTINRFGTGIIIVLIGAALTQI